MNRQGEVMNRIWELVQQIPDNTDSDFGWQKIVADRPAWPIPFFCDIRTAKLITVGVNSAVTEFEKWRRWEEVMGKYQLMARLINYFDPSNVEPHKWFRPYRQLASKHGVDCERRLAAHVDVCPYATKFWMTKHSGNERRLFRKMCELTAGHFFDTLKLCVNCRLIVIAGSIICDGDGEWEYLDRFIKDRAVRYGFEWRLGRPFSRLVCAETGLGPFVWVNGFGPSDKRKQEKLERRFADSYDEIRIALFGKLDGVNPHE